MILDLHTHTINSYDGFTMPKELLAACKLRGVDAVAITEHDLQCSIDPEPFANHGIEIIPGCEFTDKSGAHIIGLFVRKGLPFGSCTVKIIDHIHGEGGFALMPHPWKPVSGFMVSHEESELISRFDFIELINGGWRAREKSHEIVRLAEKFGLRMISASDSHKGCQVGLCCTSITVTDKALGARAALASTSQSDIDLLIDQYLLERYGRRVNSIQRSPSYQALLPLVPKQVKRAIKLMSYRAGHEPYAQMSNFQKIDVKSSPW